MNILAFSGGKDSTACALLEAEAGTDFVLFFTPTGDELPDLYDHIALVARLTGRKLIVRSCGKSLYGLIDQHKMLPSHHARWCTRELKILVCKAFLLENPGSTLLVGLRADEVEREGMWGSQATYRYPLRERGLDLPAVKAVNRRFGVTVPDRTDCALCYDQRLSEWWKLWKNHPERFARGVELEKEWGHTFRSDTRDSWPASLEGLAEEFSKGRLPRGLTALPLFNQVWEEPDRRCRVCSL